MLTDKKIILGICGGIASYKVADWTRELRRLNAQVTVVMTKAACRFVTPLTFAALSGNRVYSSIFDNSNPEDIPHISLAQAADLILIAPATAQTIARLAGGMADDLLATIVLAAKCKVVICPAMNSNMYQNPATTRNIQLLQDYGHSVVAPDCGMMACKQEGPGRLPDWDTARDAVLAAFAEQDLSGKTVLITAGPTQEPLDPVRYLGNRSSGKMGYALARTAKRRGAKVILVAGPVALPDITGIKTIHTKTAAEMYKAVDEHYSIATIIIKAAAVSDFRPDTVSAHKIKKGDNAPRQIKLSANRDILKELGSRKQDPAALPFLVGFAAESRDLIAEGTRKLTEKNLNLMVVNDISSTDAGFAVDTNRVIIIDRDGTEERLPLLSKEETADKIWNRVVSLMAP